VPQPEDHRQDYRPEGCGAGVRDADDQVHAIGSAGAEDRDRQRQEPVRGGGVPAGTELDHHSDHEDRDLDHGR
jgi:hypothetical protein